MPTFSRSLEKALHRALAIANEHRHESRVVERTRADHARDGAQNGLADGVHRAQSDV